MDMTNLKDYSVLIADDDDAYRENLYKVFERHFGHVWEAQDGTHAYTLYQAEQPDIIVTDISMPRLDGLSLIRKIRSHDMKTKIIVTSAHAERDYLLDAIPLHISRYVVKPFVFQELQDAIVQSLEEEQPAENIVHCSDEGEGRICKLDRQNHTITCGDETHELSTKEFLLLDALIKNENRVLSYTTIEDIVWEGEYMSSNALRTLIKKVRQKTCRDFIKNVASLGYRIDTIPA